MGLPFDAVDMEWVVHHIRRIVRNRESCFLSAPNVNVVVGCRTNSHFRDSVIHSDLSIADGMPLVWIARLLLDVPIRGRIAGSSLFEALRSNPVERLSVFFFGGQEGVAEIACQRLNADAMGLICAGFDFPGFGSFEEMSGDERIAKINASGADFLVVSLGVKKGQAWIEHNRARISVPVISHLGAVVDFVAERVRRAPTWTQRAGFEWLWRVKEDPGLWRRYLFDGLVFLWLLVARVIPYAWYLRRHTVDADQLATARVEASEDGQNYIIRLRGMWTRRNISPLRGCFSKAVLTEKNVRLEMGGVTYVDSAFVGLVTLLQGHQKKHGRQLLMVDVQEPVHLVIKYCCAEYLMFDDELEKIQQ